MNRYFARLAQRSDLAVPAKGVQSGAETAAWGEESLETSVAPAIDATAPDHEPMPAIASGPGPDPQVIRTATPGRTAVAVAPTTAGPLLDAAHALAMPEGAATTSPGSTVNSASRSTTASRRMATRGWEKSLPEAERDATQTSRPATLKPGDPQCTDLPSSLHPGTTLPPTSAVPTSKSPPGVARAMPVGSGISTSTATSPADHLGEAPAASSQGLTTTSATRPGNLRSHAHPLADFGPVRASVPHATPVQVSIGRVELTLHGQPSAPPPAPAADVAEVPVRAESAATPRFNPHRHYLRGT